ALRRARRAAGSRGRRVRIRRCRRGGDRGRRRHLSGAGAARARRRHVANLQCARQRHQRGRDGTDGPEAVAVTNDIIRVVLADDHAVVRAGLRAVLGGARDMQVIGEASNGVEAVAMTQRLDPDVLVMDLSMPEMDGSEATRILVSAGTKTRILILTMHSADEALVPLLESGASGFLQKSAADRELVDAVRAVAHGDTYLQPSAARVLAGGLRKKAEHVDERTKYER